MVRARPVRVAAMDEVKVVALESRARFRIKTYSYQQTASTGREQGQTDAEKGHQVWTNDLS